MDSGYFFLAFFHYILHWFEFRRKREDADELRRRAEDLRRQANDLRRQAKEDRDMATDVRKEAEKYEYMAEQAKYSMATITSECEESLKKIGGESLF